MLRSWILMLIGKILTIRILLLSIRILVISLIMVTSLEMLPETTILYGLAKQTFIQHLRPLLSKAGRKKSLPLKRGG